MRPSGSYVPFLRPAPPYIIDVGRECYLSNVQQFRAKYISFFVMDSYFRRRRTQTTRPPHYALSLFTLPLTRFDVL